MSVVGMLRAQWDARVRPSPVWARLAAEAELEAKNADLSTDWYLPSELYTIAAELVTYAECLEYRVDLAIKDDAA